VTDQLTADEAAGLIAADWDPEFQLLKKDPHPKPSPALSARPMHPHHNPFPQAGEGARWLNL
jgi:hypothetical protein